MRALFFIPLIFLLSSCSGPQSPVLKSIADVEVREMNFNNVTLDSELLYHNPNALGANVKSSDIAVSVNDIPVGNVKQLATVEIEGKSDFTVPVTISFPPKDILKKEGLLKSVLQVYANEKAIIKYLGTMTFTIGGIDFDVPIDHEEEVALKK